MITIKDYAKQKGVSYEAIRKQIKRYEKDLEGHLVKQNRFLMLDDDAVKFLDGKRAENPVIVYEQNKDEELEQLRGENKNLLIKMNLVQDQLGKIQQKLIAEMNNTQLLTQEKMQYIEYKAQAEQKELQIHALSQAQEKTQEKISQQEALIRLKEQQIGALTTARETAAANLAELKKEIAQQQQRTRETEKKLDDQMHHARETEAELDRLRHRGFWDRLFNR